jgi:hypothetical protein
MSRFDAPLTADLPAVPMAAATAMMRMIHIESSDRGSCSMPFCCRCHKSLRLNLRQPGSRPFPNLPVLCVSSLCQFPPSVRQLLALEAQLLVLHQEGRTQGSERDAPKESIHDAKDIANV